MRFRNREDAGRQLAEDIVRLELADPVVLALPRGGVPVAAPIAAALSAPLDVLVVRKVGAPGNPELAVAAIVDGNPPDIVLNHDVIEAYGLDDDDLSMLIKAERPELERRGRAYRGRRHRLSLTGKTAIVVDDGAATGTTMKVALRALKHRSPREIVAALPVAPPQTVAELRPDADRILCLSQPSDFRALSMYYQNFSQIGDQEVSEMLAVSARNRRRDRLSRGRGDGSS
jgi:putative phosphoribosyl transferase